MEMGRAGGARRKSREPITADVLFTYLRIYVLQDGTLMDLRFHPERTAIRSQTPEAEPEWAGPSQEADCDSVGPKTGPVHWLPGCPLARGATDPRSPRDCPPGRKWGS